MVSVLPKHLRREIEKLKKQILTLSAVVEENVYKAVRSLDERDVALAQEVIAGDSRIDQMEVDVEEECLKVLALYQPVAVDLRFIISILKINNDLERVGDLAVNIAERSCFLSTREKPEIPLDFPKMVEKTRTMLRKSLDALVNMDVDLAFKVIMLDDEVDELKNVAYDKIKKAMSENPDIPGFLINLLLISRHLERLGDHATNIAEEVIYMVEGEIVRHGNY